MKEGQMNTMSQAPEEKKDDQSLPLHLPDELKVAAFSNNAFVEFNPEQFNLDMFDIARMSNSVVARVIMTPQGFKRFTVLCLQQLKKYEELHGVIGRSETAEQAN